PGFVLTAATCACLQGQQGRMIKKVVTLTFGFHNPYCPDYALNPVDAARQMTRIGDNENFCYVGAGCLRGGHFGQFSGSGSASVATAERSDHRRTVFSEGYKYFDHGNELNLSTPASSLRCNYHRQRHHRLESAGKPGAYQC